MDLASSAGQLWSLHATFQREDESEAVQEERAWQEMEQLQHVVDDLKKGASSTSNPSKKNLYKITESYDESDCEDQTSLGEELDEYYANNYKTNIAVNPYQPNGLYLNDDRSYKSLEEDSSEAERSNDSDSDSDDDSIDEKRGAPAPRLGVTRLPPLKQAAASQPKQTQEEEENEENAAVSLPAVATTPAATHHQQIPLEGLDNESVCSLESDMSDEQEEVQQQHPSEATGLENEQQEEDAHLGQDTACFDKVQLLSPSYFDAMSTGGHHDHDNTDAFTTTSGAASASVYSTATPPQPPQQQQHLPLSSLITPMDPKLFMNDDLSSPPERLNNKSEELASVYHSVASHASTYNVHPNNNSPSALMDLDQYSEMLKDQSNAKHSKLSSSFKSNQHENHRVLYTLAGGKREMTKQERQDSKSYLSPSVTTKSPGKKKPQPFDTTEKPSLVTPESKSSTSSRLRHGHRKKYYFDDEDGLSILLVELQHKVFEIVAVPHVYQETTVGEVLSKARTQATDPLLSQQTYVSLCNSDGAELAAPMLPVHLMVQDESKAASRRNRTNNNTDTTTTTTPVGLQAAVPHQQHLVEPSSSQQNKKERMLRHYDQLEQERAAAEAADKMADMSRLLVAVPEGASAEQVRQVQKALWNHPRVQRWWKKRHGKKKKKKSSSSSSKTSNNKTDATTRSTTKSPPPQQEVSPVVLSQMEVEV